MVEKFATKRDINGNRLYLVVDHERKEYTRQINGWFCKSDGYIIIGKRELHRMVDELKANGYNGRDRIVL